MNFEELNTWLTSMHDSSGIAIQEHSEPYRRKQMSGILQIPLDLLVTQQIRYCYTRSLFPETGEIFAGEQIDLFRTDWAWHIHITPSILKFPCPQLRMFEARTYRHLLNLLMEKIGIPREFKLYHFHMYTGKRGSPAHEMTFLELFSRILYLTWDGLLVDRRQEYPPVT